MKQTSIGKYTVFFQKPFSKPPIFVGTAHGRARFTQSMNLAILDQLDAKTSNGVSVGILNTKNDNLTNAEWEFVAIGN